MRNLRIAATAALLALLLGGCAADLAKLKQTIQAAVSVYNRVSTATVSPENIVVTATAFDAAKSLATSYLRFCKISPAAKICEPGTVVKPGPLRLVIKYAREGTEARNQLEPYIVNGGAGPGDIYNALVDALNSLNAQPIAQAGG